MIFKIKNYFFLSFLILLQSCSGGKVGNFLESSFNNLENSKTLESSEENLYKKKVLNLERKGTKKKNRKGTEIVNKSKDNLYKNKVINIEKKGSKKNNIQDIEIVEKSKNFLENKQVSYSKNQLNKPKKIKKENKKLKQRSNELESYKIIFILKDVDPKDPIQELSNILRDSDINFEIEKIERFFDSKRKNIKKN